MIYHQSFTWTIVLKGQLKSLEGELWVLGPCEIGAMTLFTFSPLRVMPQTYWLFTFGPHASYAMTTMAPCGRRYLELMCGLAPTQYRNSCPPSYYLRVLSYSLCTKLKGKPFMSGFVHTSLRVWVGGPWFLMWVCN